MSKTLGVDIFIREMSLILKICVSFAALLCWREKPVSCVLFFSEFCQVKQIFFFKL